MTGFRVGDVVVPTELAFERGVFRHGQDVVGVVTAIPRKPNSVWVRMTQGRVVRGMYGTGKGTEYWVGFWKAAPRWSRKKGERSNAERDREICRLVDEGHTMIEVGRRFNISGPRVCAIYHSQGTE